ncbi:MAG: hypothetical protein NTZ78_00395 [Candidatus Aureabacteria bacterium]|nr:hypothetical protein [Candidatus Auribacterota bacterium]
MEAVQSAAAEIAPEKTRPASLIRLIGVCAIILGAFPIVYYLGIVVYLVQSGEVKKLPTERVVFFFILLALSLVLPVARALAGYGLIRMKQWGRRLGMAVFTIDFLLGLASGAYFSIHCYRIRYLSEQIYNEIVSRGTENMISSYILALVSLLFIALLSRDSVKECLAPGSGERA